MIPAIFTGVDLFIATLPSIIPYIPKALEVLVVVLHKVAEIVEEVAEVLGVLSPEKTEELGDKSLQAEAEGHGPDDYETYDQYVSFLNDFKLDPEKSKDIPEEAKLAHGLAIKIKQIDSKFENNDFSDLFPEIFRKPDYFNANRVCAILDTFAKGDIAVHKFSDYLDSKLSGTESKLVEDKLVEAEKSLDENKGKSDSEIRDNIEESRRV